MATIIKMTRIVRIDVMAIMDRKDLDRMDEQDG